VQNSSTSERKFSIEGETMQHQPYEKVRNLLESLGDYDSELPRGKMEWHSGGDPGGFWRLKLGKGPARQIKDVPVRNDEANGLDHLYVAKVDNPKTWSDWEHDPGVLREDAFWRLVDMFPRSQESLRGYSF
jgi:hypothetical protein